MKFDTPLEAFLYWEENTPDNLFFKQPIDGKTTLYTYGQAGDEIRRMASVLKGLALPENSHIALLSKNCAHWIMADLAIMMAGHVSIPIYPTLNAESIKTILVHSESKAIIVGKLDDFESQKAGIPDIHTIAVRAYGVEEGLSWEELVSQNEPLRDIREWKPDDLMTIIYTSGTTGKPKGVMHVAGSFAKIINVALKVIILPPHPRFFSYLPLTHIAERVGVEMHGLFKGASITFTESLETFAADLEATQPDLFFAVPRIWSKFQEKILEKMPQKKLNTLLKIPVLNTIVKKKITKKLGLSRVSYIASAAAPLAVSTMEWFGTLGITIYQAYAMTEDCIHSHFNLVGANKVGTVGRPLPDVQVKLTGEGEICIKTECLMKGYYKEPILTDEVFDDEGYFKTGDIGTYDDEGYLTITGRVKDQFKTDKGKYISPAPIELELTKNSDIELVCVVGTGIPQPVALVVLSQSGKSKDKENLEWSLRQTIEAVNPTLEKHEKISRVIVMKDEWTVENGLLTPTLKTKRNKIEDIHQSSYKQWYDEPELVVYE